MTLKKISTTLTASLVLSLGLFGGIAVPASAANNSVQDQSQSIQDEPKIETEQLNENQTLLSSEDLEFYIEGNLPKAKNISTGEVEILPGTAEDQNGNEINIYYEITDSGELLVSMVPPEVANADSGASVTSIGDDLTCWGGIVSNGVLGGLAGLPLGPAGSVIGAAAGSTNGTINHC